MEQSSEKEKKKKLNRQQNSQKLMAFFKTFSDQSFTEQCRPADTVVKQFHWSITDENLVTATDASPSTSTFSSNTELVDQNLILMNRLKK